MGINGLTVRSDLAFLASLPGQRAGPRMLIRAGGRISIKSQVRQAYLRRGVGITRSCAEIQSSISLTLSPTGCSASQQAQVLSSLSSRTSSRGT